MPGPRRMSDLSGTLGLDKTLASRVNRAALAATPIEALALGPGAAGYRLLLERLIDRYGSSAEFQRLAVAIDALEHAYANFPGGRHGFDAALLAWFPVSRQKAERRARQQIFNATLVLMGLEVELTYYVYVYAPSRADPTAADLILVQHHRNVRRARLGGRAIISGLPSIHANDPMSLLTDDAIRMETLDGRPLRSDASIAMVTDLCSPPDAPLMVMERGNTSLFVAPGTLPALGEKLTATVGVVGRNMLPRWAGTDPGAETHLSNFVTMRKPVKLLVLDVLVDERLNLGEPRLTVSAASAGPHARSPDDDDLAEMPQALEFQPLGVLPVSDLSRLALKNFDGIPAIAARAVAATSGPSKMLRAHRLTVEYPIPHARHTMWLALPPAPPDQRS